MIKIDDKKCCASKDSCKAIAMCPLQCISYVEVEEPLLDCADQGNTEVACGCSCNCQESKSDCGTNPYARIIIDTEKCIVCGICIEECCGQAIYFED